MNITVTINTWLWLLCGRSSGFCSALLNTGLSYGTPQPSDVVRKARTLLCLDDTRTDFHVLAALAAVMDVAQVLRELPEDGSTVFSCFVSHTPEAVTITGAAPLPPTGALWSSIRNTPTRIPAPTVFTVTRESSDRCRVTDDTGASSVAPWNRSGNGVAIPFLKSLGIDSAFAVASWEDGDEFSLAVPPTRYPYAHVAARIADPDLIRLMLDTGTLETFATTSDPVRKVGALAAAIMLDQYRSAAQLEVPVLLSATSAATVAGTFDADYQLSVDWRGITLDYAPVTYTDDNYPT